MAFSRITVDETVQIPVPTPCDLCLSEDEVNSYCRNCAQKLCDTCKKLHLRTTTNRDHIVVHVSEGPCLTDEPMICQEHRQTLQFYCRTCSSLSCPKCLPKQHNGHDFVDTDEYAEEVRRKSAAVISEREKMKEEKEQKLAAIIKDEDTYMKTMNASKNSIREIVKCIVDDVHNIETELLSEITKRESKDLQFFENEKKTVATEKEELEGSIQKLKLDSESQDPLSLIRSTGSQQGGLEPAGSFEFTAPKPTEHIRGSGDRKADLKKIVGYLQYCKELPPSRVQLKGPIHTSSCQIELSKCSCQVLRRYLREYEYNKCRVCHKPIWESKS